MAQTDPEATTVRDLCNAALIECGAVGIGQAALPNDLVDAQTRLQWMLQQWERQRWLVYHLVTSFVVTNGNTAYTVGPAGDFDTGSPRPEKIEYAFLRQGSGGEGAGGGDFNEDFNEDFDIGTGMELGGGKAIDFPLHIAPSMEDYNAIALKGLQSFASVAFYDPKWPQGLLYAWPVPQANLYSLAITYREQLPSKFESLDSPVVLPYEYFSAIMYNLALRLRPKFQLGTYPGDPLPGLAKSALEVITQSNTALGVLRMPPELTRSGVYNIFSDRTY